MYSPDVLFEIGKQKHQDDLKQAALIRLAREDTADNAKDGMSFRQKIKIWMNEVSGRKAEECVVAGECCTAAT